MAKRKAKQPQNAPPISVSEQTQKRKPRGKPFPPGNKVGKRFPEGVSGNPGGRPKLIGEAHARNLERTFPAYLITSEMQRVIDVTYGGEKVEVNYAEKIALQQQLAAASGDVAAAKEIRAATEGDRLELTGKDGAGLVIRVVYDEKPIDGIGNPPPET